MKYIKWSNFKKNRKWKLCILLILVFFPLIINSVSVYALGDDQIINVITKNPKFFIQNDMWKDGFRNVSWAIVSILLWVAQSCQTLYENTLGLIDFTTSSNLEAYIKTLKGLFTAIMALSIMMIGIILIVHHEKKPKLLISICLAGFSISAISSVLIKANEGIKAFATETVGDSMALEIVNENFYDLLYIDKVKGLSTLDSTNAAYMSQCHYTTDIDWTAVNITEVINYDSPYITTDDAKEILKKQIFTYYDGNSNLTYGLSGVYNGFGWNDGEDADFFNAFYYRYKVNYFPIDLTLISIAIVFICMSYKVMRLIYEIATTRLLAMLYSADLNGTQKTMKIFGSLRDSYIVLGLTAILIKLFKLAQTYLASQFLPNNTFSYSLLLLFTAFAVIDGPNLIQQLTGIDAGLSSGVGKMIAAYHAVRGVTNTVKGAAHTAAAPFERQRQNRMHQEILKANNQNANSNLSALNGNTENSKNGNMPNTKNNPVGNSTGSENNNMATSTSSPGSPSATTDNMQNESLNNSTDNNNSLNDQNLQNLQQSTSVENTNNQDALNGKIGDIGHENGTETTINNPFDQNPLSKETDSAQSTFEKMNSEIPTSVGSGNLNGIGDTNGKANSEYTGSIFNPTTTTPTDNIYESSNNLTASNPTTTGFDQNISEINTSTTSAYGGKNESYSDKTNLLNNQNKDIWKGEK